MKYAISFLLVFSLLFSGCAKKEYLEIAKSYPESITFSIQNPTNLNRTDEIISVDIDMIKSISNDFNSDAFVVLVGNTELPSQAIDINGDGAIDVIKFVTNMAANSSEEIMIRFASSGKLERNYTQRTQAELSHKFDGEFKDRKYIGGKFKNVNNLRVPAEHTDHSSFIRYEGPGWESDKVGYRYYLDWRNAIDIFGKKVSDMVLQNVGQDGYDSYHEMSDWGMDILNVGESLGIGSIAAWNDNKAYRVAETDTITCQITAKGPIYSQITTRYYGWKIEGKKYDLISNLSITAGSRMTKHSISITNNPDNLCTGIVKHDNTKILKGSKSNNGWNYLATYGKQSLADDNLGMAILYKNSDVMEITEDENSHVTVLKVNEGNLDYYFLAAWEKEPNGIKNGNEFQKYLDVEIEKLNNPLVINF